MVGKRGLLRLLLVGAVGAGVSASIASRAAFTASTANTLPGCMDPQQLVPQIGASMVNQGVGSYADPGNRLVRGKDTEVRFFLVTPAAVGSTCSGSIFVRSANLTVANGPASYATAALQSFGTSGTLIPSSILSVDSTADPKFVLPAANANSCLTTPCTDTGGFTLTFTATINYTTSLQSTPQVTTTPATAASFDRPSNALRVLAIPMGDSSQAYSTQFSDGARVAVENGFATLSRIYPLPGGVSSTLATTVGGLRYKLDLAAMLNLKGISGAYDGGGKFCGTQANFDAGIKSQLAGYLTVYNGSVTSPAYAADRVMGVVDKAISDGSTSTFNCAEAMASTVSPEMWVRAIPDQPAAGKNPAVPSMTGGLMAMEMSHTFAMDVTPSFHSANTQADVTAPERGYNLSSRSYLSDDRSTMRFVSTNPFNNNNALFERDDYEHMLCNLGGSLAILPGTTTPCPTTPSGQSVGTVAAAGPTFAIFGTSDFTPGGTHVLESYKGDNGDPVFQINNGPLSLKFYDTSGNPVGGDVPVPYSTTTSDHDSTGSVNHTTAVFGGLFDAPAGYARADLVYNGTVLYTRTSTPLDPVSAGVGNVAPGGSVTIKKALTTPVIPPKPDIVFLSDTTGSMGDAIGNVKTNVTTIMDQVLAAQPDAEFGVAEYKDFATDCATAYTLDHTLTNVKTDVANAVGTWTAGCGVDTPEADFWGLHNLVADAGWRSGSSKIIVWIGDAPSHDPTGPDSEHQVTQASVIGELQAAGIRVIAVNVGNLDSAGQATAIVNATGGVLTTSDPTQVSTAILDGLHNLPAAVTPQVVSCDPGLSIGFDADSKTVTSGTQVSFTETASIASSGTPGSTLTCTVHFLVNGLPVDDPSFTEVVSLKLSGGSAVVATFETPDPDQLRAHVIYDCGNGEKEPALVGLQAMQVSTNIAQFQANVDPSLSCANGSQTAALEIVGTNGIDAVSQTIPTSPATLPVADKAPSAAIYQPTLDLVMPYTSQLSLNGHVADPEDGNLTAHWAIVSGPMTPAITNTNDVVDVPPPTTDGWPAGDYAVQLSGTDSHGHTATATVTVHVVHYGFSGFLQPVDNPPTLNVGQAGKTYPVKWTLTQNGAPVADLSAIESLKYGSAPCGTAPADGLETSATGGTSLRLDSTTGQYIYNWQTPSAAGCYILLLTLADGSIWPAYFKLN
jgi:von Willebrand factor type A domain